MRKGPETRFRGDTGPRASVPRPRRLSPPGQTITTAQRGAPRSLRGCGMAGQGDLSSR